MFTLLRLAFCAGLAFLGWKVALFAYCTDWSAGGRGFSGFMVMAITAPIWLPAWALAILLFVYSLKIAIRA